MRPQHEALHGRLSGRALPQSLIQDAFEPELGEPFVRVYRGSHLEEAVGWARAVRRVERRVAAAK